MIDKWGKCSVVVHRFGGKLRLPTKNRGQSICKGAEGFSSHAFRGPSWADLKLINQSSLLPLSPLSACTAACHAVLLTLLLSNGLKVKIPPPFPFYAILLCPS